MNKKLFTQIKNEWRSNLWLVTELLLVSVVLWYIVDYMYVQTSIVSIRPRACFFPLFSFLPLWLHYNLNPLCVQY